jgi:hypothetical protein
MSRIRRKCSVPAECTSLPTKVGLPGTSILPATWTLASFGFMRTSAFFRKALTKPSGPRTGTISRTIRAWVTS